MAHNEDALKHLFQQEFAKMVAVISKRFGLQHVEIAEDIVSETFLVAAEQWGIDGLPPNPTAWLYAVAKQKALYQFRRNKIFEQSVLPEIAGANQENPAGLDFSFQNIKDSQLHMLFAVCNPVVASEAQIGLALRILCGFGIDEIAEAFFTTKETVNKRLFRAKEKLRTENVTMEMPRSEDELVKRLDNVLHILYLLFNEGYYSRTQNRVLRKDLCYEALQLVLTLTEYEPTNRPKTNALIALMCFHASRFDARLADGDSMVLYEEQNELLWNQELIQRGIYFLHQSMEGNEISSYHLEARIASWHCTKEDTREKWEDILRLYDQLLLINYSPGVMLNRIYAFYKVHGSIAAIIEAEKLNLDGEHFYFVLLGELYKDVDRGKARVSFEKGFSFARTETERESIRKKIASISL
jgi:RNA polymerase sigma factor (sigma-70 family)